MDDRQLTLGECRVGVNFNPSKNPLVDDIKLRAAGLIDLIETIKPVYQDDGLDELTFLGEELLRLTIIAQNQIESAAMFAVKAATKL